jgi:DNA-binding protein HU-beta
VATKKAVAKKTALPAKKTMAKSTPAKAPVAVKAPVLKMTKIQVIRQMAEQMDVPPKQIGAFFDLLIEIATTQTRKAGEFTIPGLGKLVKAQRAARMGRNPATGESIKIAVPSFQGCQGCCRATKEVVQWVPGGRRGASRRFSHGEIVLAVASMAQGWADAEEKRQ